MVGLAVAEFRGAAPSTSLELALDQKRIVEVRAVAALVGIAYAHSLAVVSRPLSRAYEHRCRWLLRLAFCCTSAVMNATMTNGPLMGRRGALD